MAEYVPIKRNINKNITIGNFTVQEMLFPVGTFLVFYFLKVSFYLIIIATGLAIYYMIVQKEINETRIKGYYKDWLWWRGLNKQDYKHYPPSYARELVG